MTATGRRKKTSDENYAEGVGRRQLAALRNVAPREFILMEVSLDNE